MSDKNIKHRLNDNVILRAKDISFSYDGKKDILSEINIEFRSGVMCMMLGRSGTGKTTFLKILANLVKPTRGEVQIIPAPGALPQQRTIAYIPQNLGLVRNLTALDNVLIGALGQMDTFSSLLKNFPLEICQKAQQLLSDLGIAHLSQKKVWSLSGGERQRVAIARALIQQPRIILADEFVSQLDPVTTIEILTVLKKLVLDGVSFVITTHDMSLIKNFADQLIYLRNGRVSVETCPVILIVEEILDKIR